MKRAALLSVCATIASVSLAQADTKYGTLPATPPIVPAPAAVTDFSGAFVGGLLSLSRSRNNVLDLDGYNGADFSHRSKSDFGAAIVGGYNWQRQNLVYGVMGEIGHLGVSSSAQFPGFVGDPARVNDSIASTRVGGYAALSGRAGFVAGPMMFYGRAGVAAGQVRVSYTDTNPLGLTLDSGTSVSKTRVAPLLGLGVEYMVSPNMTLSLDYSYMDFGKLTHTAVAGGGANFSFQHRVKVDTLRMGMNFRF